MFPTFFRDHPLQVENRPKSATFIELANNAFNYHTLGRCGFDVLATMIDRCACLSLTYSDLDAAIAFFDTLAENARAAA